MDHRAISAAVGRRRRDFARDLFPRGGGRFKGKGRPVNLTQLEVHADGVDLHIGDCLCKHVLQRCLTRQMA